MIDRKALLEESPWRLMRKLSLPGILGMMVLSLNSLIDSIYLGTLVSAEAFAGAAALFPISLVISSVTGFIAAGSSSVLSRAIGSENEQIQRKILPNLIALSLVSGVVLTIAGVLFPEPIVSVMGLEGNVEDQAVLYFRAYATGTFFSIYGLSANGLIRAEGKMQQAMTFTVVAVVSNIIFTPIFISWLNLGVSGAAYSSVASMGIYSLLTSLYYIRGKASFETGGFAIRFEMEILRDVASVGLSSFSMQMAGVFRQFIVFRTVTWYGTMQDLVIFSAIFRLFSFVSIPAMGLLQPLQPVVGVNYGAKVWDRCKKNLYFFRKRGVLLSVLLAVPVAIFPSFFLELMIPDQSLTYDDLLYTRLVLLALPFLPLSTTAIIYLQATGQGKRAASLPLLRQAVIFLPLILLFPFWLGASGVYAALVMDNLIYGTLLSILIQREMTKLPSVT